MTENNQIPTWAEDLLVPNEEIIWMHSVGEQQTKGSRLFMFIFFSLICIFFYVVINPMMYEFSFILVVIVLLLGSAIFGTGSNKVTYIATDERIIILKEKYKASPRSLYYRKIHNIKSTDNNIYFYDRPLNQRDKEDGQIPSIRNVSNAKDIVGLIQKYWYPKSIYHQYISEIEYIAEMYDLELDKNLAHEKLVISIKGKLEGMPFHLNMHSLHYPTAFKIEIVCPNVEKNSLLIKQENSSHSIAKLMGMQDIDTKNDIFNQQYLLQSNNLTFFNHILNEKMINDISEANKYLSGTFTINEKREKKKPKINSEDILDADMFDFYSNDLTQNEGHLSTLKYEVENMVSLTDTELVMKKSLEVFKTMINLGLAIKRY